MAKYVPRERKRRRLDKAREQSSHGTQEVPDVIIPEIAKSEREARRAKLAAEVREQVAQATISSKKRKRLEKYVDAKLRKEENLELLEKIAAQKVDTSLLRSSKTLGQVRETKRERFSRALLERQAGLKDDSILYQRRAVSEPEPGSSGDEAVTHHISVGKWDSTQQGGDLGSGLKTPLDPSGRPIIRKRKRSKRAAGEPQPLTSVAEEDEGSQSSDHADAEEWNGFDTVDAGDTAQIADDFRTATDDEHTDGESSSDTGSDIEPDDDDGTNIPDGKQRISAFKQWADMQRNVALDFIPSAVTMPDPVVHANFVPRQPSPDPALTDLTTNSGERSSRPAAAITIQRIAELQAARLELPVVQEEQRIMEAINTNPIVIICGATGSGKTTQVPQMMFESGYGSHIGVSKTEIATAGPQSKGMIGVTQPRRVAATSVSERVSYELGPQNRGKVAYQVRYDSNITRDTAIKFMTDGILLREMNQDFVLSKYSAIIIDEAHERSVNTDVLIGALSRIVPLRAQLAQEQPDKFYPLKLVIMSATLRIVDFASNERLFKGQPPPILEIEGRQHPVTVHFSRKTRMDYVSEMVEKVARGHRKLPPGGMLVFLTSQDEIRSVQRRLADKLSSTASLPLPKSAAPPSQMREDDDGALDFHSVRYHDEEDGEHDDADSLDLDSEDDDIDFLVKTDQHEGTGGHNQRGQLRPYVLPLYAALPSAQQKLVFQPAPAGSRLIVIATNVAETSITIPGIRYVFDCGRAKEKRYNITTGVQTFEVDWISKASASQRMGRAGRTGPGHCYRLYSSAVYEESFSEHTTPEILRTPLESTVLQLKDMEIDNVLDFPFPTTPDPLQLATAERLLRTLGAIDSRTGKITNTGRRLMLFPVNPRFGKMLLLAQRNNMLRNAIAVVAGLAVGEIYIPETQIGPKDQGDLSPEDGHSAEHSDLGSHNSQKPDSKASDSQRQLYSRAHATLARWDNQSDAIKLFTTVAVYGEATARPHNAASVLCHDYFLREKAMKEVQQLRIQLSSLVRTQYPTFKDNVEDAISPPSEKERSILNQIVASGFVDQVAIRTDLLPSAAASDGRKPRRAIEVPYRTLMPSAEVDSNAASENQALQSNVFVHSSSVLAKLSVQEMPSYIVYSHLSRAQPVDDSLASSPRVRMHPLTAVSAKVLASLAEGTPLLEIGKPIQKIEELPRSSAGELRRQCWVDVGLRASTGAAVWPLTVWKVVQYRTKMGVWVIEKVMQR